MVPYGADSEVDLFGGTVGPVAAEGPGPVRISAMAVVNTEHLGAKLVEIEKKIDPESRAKVMQQAVDETNRALSNANDALKTGQVTLELAKDVAPVMTQLTALSAKLELIDQRLQAIEKKPQGCCSIS